MIKRVVGWVVLVPLCAALIVFALANRQLVVINLNPLAPPEAIAATGVGVPMFIVLFVALLVGVVLGGIAAWFAQGPHRRDERHYRRETERLHRELEVARRAPDSPLIRPDELAPTS